MAETPPDDGLIRIDQPARRAWQGARELQLTPRGFDLLTLLHRNAGAVVTREEIRSQVWGTPWISRPAISLAISILRRALGDDAAAPRYIANLHSVGYRFEADMVPARADVVELAPVEHRLPLRVDGQLVYDADGALVAVAMSPRVAAWIVECTRQDRPLLKEADRG